MIEPLRNKSEESKLEVLKHESNNLRGTIKSELTGGQPRFGQTSRELLKFHGIYEQADRDHQRAAKAAGGHAAHSHMLRVVIPGGMLTADQYLALDRLAEEQTPDRSLRITTRQCLQLYGIEKPTLREVIQTLDRAGLTSFAGSGDVQRNVMAPPAPIAEAGYASARTLAQTLSLALRPQTRAYEEIWLNGDDPSETDDTEPLYGPRYLPRKFKTGIALIEDNAVDVHSQDVGLILLTRDAEPRGVNLLVGGGLGMTHRRPDTYARLASPLGHVAVEHAVDAVRAVLTLFRNYGDRTDRKHARLKYVIEEVGADAFREEVQKRVGFELRPWVDIPLLRKRNDLGRQAQGDGRCFYGVPIPNGRISDTHEVRLKTALRWVVQTLRPSVALTPNQDILFGGLDDQGVGVLAEVLAAYRVPTVDQLSPLRCASAACPGPPTCGKALNESERVMPAVITELESEFGRLGLNDRPITVRMTGCPNGCARPYTAEVGLVGHKPGAYDIFVGGRAAGGRLGDLYAENVPLADIVPSLRPLLQAWRRRGLADESLGDCYQRLFGRGVARHLLTGARDEPARTRVAGGPPNPGPRTPNPGP